MTAAEGFQQTIQTLVLLFIAGAVLVLILGRFNLKRIMGGELGARYLGWLLLTPVYGAAVFASPVIGAAIMTGAILLMVLEYGRAVNFVDREMMYLGFLVVVSMIVVVWLPRLFAPLPVIVLFTLTAYPILTNTYEAVYDRVRSLSWAYIYVIWTMIHGVFVWLLPQGQGILVVIMVGCGLADIGAYVVGKQIGRRKIAPRISPNKAWEGILGDLIGASIAVVLFGFGLPEMPTWTIIGLVVVIGVGSVWGDLISSMAKRNLDIKDWGNLIPGHGGLLDRLNSLIVVMPVTYYYMIVVLGL